MQPKSLSIKLVNESRVTMSIDKKYAQNTVHLKRGSLYLSGELYDRYFSGLETIILLGKNEDFLIMPVRNAASGGYLLKLKNSSGDRIINAMDFFRDQGFPDETDIEFDVEWDQEMSALKVKNHPK